MTRSPRSVAIRNNVVPSSPRDMVGGSNGVGSFTSSLTVFFYDSTPGVPTSWSWTFYAVNGSVLATSTLQNPSYTYPATGTYRVTLTTNNSTTMADELITVV